MRPAESFIGQPVRSLQTMLRVLGEHDDQYFNLVPDGIYGQQTMAAVSNFQRLHGLPVTGVADQATWEAIHAAYEPALTQIVEAEPVILVLEPNQVIRHGERNPYLYVIQGVLLLLSEVYGSIGTPSQSGILDDATSDAISSFQALSRLPMTGNLDKTTWKHLALHFTLAANLKTHLHSG